MKDVTTFSLMIKDVYRVYRTDPKGLLTVFSNIPEIRSKRQSTFSGGNNGSDRKNMILVWSDFLLVLLPKIRS